MCWGRRVSGLPTRIVSSGVVLGQSSIKTGPLYTAPDRIRRLYPDRVIGYIQAGTRTHVLSPAEVTCSHGFPHLLLLSKNLSILKDMGGAATTGAGTRARTQSRGHSILTPQSVPGPHPARPGQSKRVHPGGPGQSKRVHPGGPGQSKRVHPGGPGQSKRVHPGGPGQSKRVHPGGPGRPGMSCKPVTDTTAQVVLGVSICNFWIIHHHHHHHPSSIIQTPIRVTISGSGGLAWLGDVTIPEALDDVADLNMLPQHCHLSGLKFKI